MIENNTFVNQDLEQAEAGMRDFAKLLRSFYINLVKEGFNDLQALALTREHLVSVIRGGMQGGE